LTGLQGETGVGKDLVAHALHSLSPRGKRPLVKLNCAALPASLVESELFGHEKGSFTGAIGLRKGRFEIADGSTLFLDEIGELEVSVATLNDLAAQEWPGNVRELESVIERAVLSSPGPALRLADLGDRTARREDPGANGRIQKLGIVRPVGGKGRGPSRDAGG
jgi:transcriptional regulator with GAF, ATPase, and Fis domain